jgi:uncharacterized protein
MKFRSYLIFILIAAALYCSGCQNRGGEKKKEIKQSAVGNAGYVKAINASMHKAALDGDLSLVTTLLDNGFPVDSVDEDGRTPLIYAAYNGHTAVIKKLIQKGASVNFADREGHTSLMMAASGPFPDAVKLLIDSQADPDMRDKTDKFTAIMYAASEGQLEVVKILLASNADPFLKDKDGDDALSFAVKNNHQAVAELLKALQQKYRKN